ncbi:MAG TPA: AlkA N-terminal domain-containing protein [Acidimicrobiales bacterium]|nr:AlkA N-terminal domain-containing protein [Acidimicrobiales bacterium]
MVEDFEHCYRAVLSRDPRFDGWFFTAVATTGIYCRPSCPARTPARRHVRFFPSAAAAQQAGFRACLRCRPDAVPGSPEWNVRADVVARAMRAIADGVVDREGVAGLAARLGYGSRHLHRMLAAEVGAGPLALARAQRTQTARLLVETTELGMAEIAFAAGFASVRQFNDTVREVLGRTPTELRRRASRVRRPVAPAGITAPGPTTIALRLPYRRPMAVGELLGFLGARAVPGVETYAAGTYTRTLRLAHGHAVMALAPGDAHVAATLTLAAMSDLTSAVARCRRLLDLDADPEAVDAALGADPLLRPLVRATPGRRVAGAVDGFETAVRAVVGQQISVAGARRVLARLAAAAGPPLDEPMPALGVPAGERAVQHGEVPGSARVGGARARVFPSPGELLCAPDDAFAMPAARRRALVALARSVEERALTLDPGADPAEVTTRLVALPGVGPWTAAYVALRALGDPDVFLPGDLGVRRALDALGVPSSVPASMARSARWRPWRSYALMHLWSITTPLREEAA